MWLQYLYSHLEVSQDKNLWFFFFSSVIKGEQAHLEVSVFQVFQAQYSKMEAAAILLHLKTLTK